MNHWQSLCGTPDHPQLARLGCVVGLGNKATNKEQKRQHMHTTGVEGLGSPHHLRLLASKMLQTQHIPTQESESALAPVHLHSWLPLPSQHCLSHRTEGTPVRLCIECPFGVIECPFGVSNANHRQTEPNEIQQPRHTHSLYLASSTLFVSR
jgi:hypothetical protein